MYHREEENLFWVQFVEFDMLLEDFDIEEAWMVVQNQSFDIEVPMHGIHVVEIYASW